MPSSIPAGLVLFLLTTLCLLGSACHSVHEEALLLGDQPFHSDAWLLADNIQRGAMVASFLRKHPRHTLTKDRVHALLGLPRGYYHQDTELAYVLGPDIKTTGRAPKNHEHTYFQLIFSPRASGEIWRIFFDPWPSDVLNPT